MEKLCTEADAMEDQLWDLFLETGEPMGYLLYKAEKKHKKDETQRPKPQPQPEGPPKASA